MRIHPTAIVHPSLSLPSDLEVGPYAVIEEGVGLAPGIRIGPFCHLYPGVHLEAGVCLSDGVILGNEPQDLKYRGEKTEVRIGEGSLLREYVTVNRGTVASGRTVIGRRCLIMAYSHVAHDCVLGDQVIVANGVQMGGHVHIGDAAVISGMTGIHQFVTIGPGAFVGGGLRVDKDILPFSKALGEPLRWAALNEIGLGKLGMPPAAGPALKAFYRGLFAEGKAAARERLADLLRPTEGASGATAESASAQSGAMAGLWKRVDDFLRDQSRGLLVRTAEGS